MSDEPDLTGGPGHDGWRDSVMPIPKETMGERLGQPTREQLLDFEEAHNEGLHDDTPREFCPLCERI